MSGWQVNKQCKDCPWRKDVPVGKFSHARFKALRGSVEQGFSPMFACHASQESDKKACVGYVINQVYATENGPENFHLRMALARQKIDPERMMLTGPQYLSYDEMVEANYPKGDDDGNDEFGESEEAGCYTR